MDENELKSSLLAAIGVPDLDITDMSYGELYKELCNAIEKIPQYDRQVSHINADKWVVNYFRSVGLEQIARVLEAMPVWYS